MVKNCHCSHCFNDGYGAWEDTRVVASACFDNGFFPVDVNRFLFAQKCCHGFERYAEADVGSVADAPLDASAVVRSRGDASVSVGDEHVVLFAASSADTGKSFAIFKTLDSVDSEHGRTQFGMQFAEGWRAQSNGAALHDAGDDSPDGVAIGFDFRDELRHFCGFFHVGAAHGVLLYQVEVELVVVALQADRPDLRSVSSDSYAKLLQCQFRQGAAYATCNGFTRR